MEIRGYSLPDAAHEFYDEIITWFREYAKEPNAETKVIFDFYYVNSTSSKFINDILKELDGIAGAGKSVMVEWFFDSDDEDIEQLGIVLKEFHKVPFTLLPKEIRQEKSAEKKLF